MKEMVALGPGEGNVKSIDNLSRTSLCAEDQHMGLCNNHKMPEGTCCKTKSRIKRRAVFLNIN